MAQEGVRREGQTSGTRYTEGTGEMGQLVLRQLEISRYCECYKGGERQQQAL